MSFFRSNTSTATGAAKDIEVADPPPDSVSSLAFSPQADYLAVSSWDNAVRVYEVGEGGATQGKAMYTHNAPVLDVCWNKDGTKVFSAGTDNTANMHDLATGQTTQVAQHDAAIKCCRWVDAQSGILATGSWDKTLKYWDLRTANPVATVALPDRCYAMDARSPLLVVGTAERHVQIFNLTDPTTPFKAIQSPLKWQTRAISCFTESSTGTGFAVGSVEGRIGIQYVEDKNISNNFSFKCHRQDSVPNTKDQAIVFAINDISFHPVHGTFSTCGSDGLVCFWDKDTRMRIKSFEPAPGSVSASAFNRSGSLFAYAVSYDWSKGYSGNTPGYPNKLMVHMCKDEEFRRRNLNRR